MKDILAKHAEVRARRGPLRQAKPDLAAAIAELQERLAKRDPGFQPVHDLRKPSKSE